MHIAVPCCVGIGSREAYLTEDRALIVLSMIKSDLMNRKILVMLVVIFLLTGCGQRRQPDVEHFQGEIVATLQKPIRQATPEPLETGLPPS
jgi:hypothetical protein